MATVRYFWHSFIHRVLSFIYLQHSRPPSFITFFQMFGRRRKPSACPSFLVFHIDRHIADKFISCVIPCPSQWLFYFGEEIVITWTHIGLIRWMFQNLPLQAAQVVRDSSSGVTSCIVMKNYGVLYHQLLHAVPENILVYKTSCDFNFAPGTLF